MGIPMVERVCVEHTPSLSRSSLLHGKLANFPSEDQAAVSRFNDTKAQSLARNTLKSLPIIPASN